MSKRKSIQFDDASYRKDAPETLANHNFFKLSLDKEQTEFRDSIWSDDYDIIFCDSKAGTGKTLIAVATACMMIRYGKYDGILYIVSPTQEEKTGYLPGSAEDKILPYTAPLKDALLAIDYNPDTEINQTSITNRKEGNGVIDCISHTYLRGVNFENKVVIIDEAQNMYLDELKKTLTRVKDTCKTIVIGHSGQCDILHNPERAGFTYYKEWYSTQERAKICSLSVNHRGWVSNHADAIDIPMIYEKLKLRAEENEKIIKENLEQESIFKADELV